MTNDDKDLKPCPCGKQPTKLHIVGSDAKWKWVSGDCCNEWNVEFRTGYYKDESPELMERAIYAWNYATRATPQQPSSKTAVQCSSCGHLDYIQQPSEPLEEKKYLDSCDAYEYVKAIVSNYSEDEARRRINSFLHRDVDCEKPQEPLKVDALDLAIMFHHAYEKLAPDIGYDTRIETRIFDPESKNGKLMIAVCQRIIDSNIFTQRSEPLKELDDFQEINFNNYDEDDVRALQDWAFKAYDIIKSKFGQPSEKKALSVDIRGEICKIVSKMLDNPDKHGIYPTTVCYNELEELFNKCLNSALPAQREVRYPDTIEIDKSLTSRTSSWSIDKIKGFNDAIDEFKKLNER